MTVVEVITARPLPGSTAPLRAADEALQTAFAYQQAGLLRRTTAWGETEWVFITYWADQAAADRAWVALARDPAGAAWLDQLEPASVDRRTFRLLA
jgi:hypothetical protein